MDCARWRRCPTRSVRCASAETRPNGLQVARSACRSASSCSSTSRGPTSPSTPPPCASRAATPSSCAAARRPIHSNAALHGVLARRLSSAEGLPADAVQLVATTDREAVGHLLQLADLIDLASRAAARSLIRRVAAEATMPVLKHYKGICHVYRRDAAADLERAEAIVVNAKCSGPACATPPSVCSSTRRSPRRSLPRVAAALWLQQASSCAAVRRRAGWFPRRSRRRRTITTPSISI